jgi:conserved oligomeric Golgi complex subunit 5
MGQGGANDAYTQEVSTAADRILSDPRYTSFLSESFDASKFASTALADTHATPQAQIDHLQQGIVQLDATIRQLVLENRPGLLSHASTLEGIDASLQRVTLSVRSLQSVATRVRAEVSAPCRQASAKTQQLRNVQRTVDILRHTLHRVKLVQRLRTEMHALETSGGDILEVSKAARLLSDIAAADAEADLSGLSVIDADAAFLADAGPRVRSRIDTALHAGLESLSQADAGSALQALYNLRELRPSVEAYVENTAASLERVFSAALDAKKLSAATSGAAGGREGGVRGMVGGLQGAGTRLQDVLWERLNEAFDSLWRSAVSIWHLERVLMKKRDPLTHELFIDVVAPPGGDRASALQRPLDIFWKKTTSAISAAFRGAFVSQRGGLVRDAITSSYPRLAAMLESTCTRILKDGSIRGSVPALTSTHASALLECVRDAESAWLSGVQSRLESSALSAFPGAQRAPPTAAELQSFVARLNEELKNAAPGGDRLATLAAAGAGVALHVAAERAELMAIGGPDARTINGTCTPAQARNISLCNALHELHRSGAALAARLPGPAAVNALAGPLEALQGAALDTVAPLFRAMVEACQDRILKMHALNLNADDGAESSLVETSQYMRELRQLLAAFRREYFCRFNPPLGASLAAVPSTSTTSAGATGGAAVVVASVGRALAERMAARLIRFYLRHASLVRPLSQPGKLQLAKDASELEAALIQHVSPQESIHGHLRALRAMRRLLFTETSQVLEDKAALADLPVDIVLQHLFSRAPSELESPCTRARLTPARFSLWLDEHSQQEALKQVRMALAAGGSAVGKDPAGGDVVAAMEALLALSNT